MITDPWTTEVLLTLLSGDVVSGIKLSKMGEVIGLQMRAEAIVYTDEVR